MGERKYSIAEIDQMRAAIRSICIQSGVAYYPAEKTAEIEERLRTYMINGTEPVELRNAADKTIRQRMEMYQQLYAPADPDDGDA